MEQLSLRTDNASITTILEMVDNIEAQYPVLCKNINEACEYYHDLQRKTAKSIVKKLGVN